MDMHSNALTCLSQSNKKKERVPDGPTIKYSQVIQNSCIISSLASALYHPWHRHCIIWEMNLRQNISSGVGNSLLISFIVKAEWNSAVILLWDNTEKNNK